ncbi:DedA family protein [Usitatibacter palustris]|uniref:Protein DedA n=1 Tax=Usitatibacter palustris TaxID=2732487 RepID=A0A6M4HAU6_9PROT|nr:DedA family protein [Usitatibacter palustris]QJR15968.1 Protein DedA [Usitatibacter palustris]
MEFLAGLLDIVLRLDVHLAALVSSYGAWVYAILFAVIFAETGLVVTPILPGDSLLFVAGAVAALGGLDVHLLAFLLVVAAVLGNTTNYAIGRWLGKRFFTDRGSRWLNPAHLDRTHAFYERHGGMAVVISRFMPIVRTYVPFVAGLGAMNPTSFTAYNVGGAVLWVGSLTYAGYFFGNVPWVKANLTLIILAIIALSLVPMVVAMIRSRA